MFDDNETEPVVVAAKIISRALDRLGNADASTPMGGLEALGAVLKEAIDGHTSALDRVAEAIESLAMATRD